MNNMQVPRSYFRTPSITPDGAQIAFVYAGDIWLASAEGGNAERLTAHHAYHTSPRWSPDGSHLALTSSRTGQGDIYILPLNGGDIRRITFHDTSSTTEAWSADGQHIFFSSGRNQQGRAIYRVPANGGTPAIWINQPYEAINHLAVSPDGSRLAFNISRDAWWRRGPNPYGGSDIWVAGNEPDATDFQKISDYAGMNAWPLWAPDNQAIYFVSDRDGTENIWRQPLDGGDATRITSFQEGRLLWPSISADGQTIVFERDFGIWRLNLADLSIYPLPLTVRNDTKFTPVRVFAYNRDLSELALAPDGKKVAFVARGEIFADFADKETDREQRQGSSFRITNTSFRESNIAWSPDSRKLAYTSDRDGDEQVFLYDFATRSEACLTDTPGRKHGPVYSPDGAWIAYAHKDDQIRLLNPETHEDREFVRANLMNHSLFTWSPDSRWLVFTAQDANSFSNLHVQHIDESSARQITFLGNIQASQPLWAPNGRFILFTTGQYRNETQIARVDLRPIAPQFREVEFEKLFDGRPTQIEQRHSHNHESLAAKRQLYTPEGSLRNDDREPIEEQPEKLEELPVSLKTEPPGPKKAPQPRVEIIFEGIERRLRFMTPIQMDADVQCISPDSRDMIFRAMVAGKTNLWVLPLDEPRAEQSPRQITSSSGRKGAVQFAPDGKSFYFIESGQIFVRKFPTGDQSLLPVQAEVTVDFHQEKYQIFDECWRRLRDEFYDPTFRGLDWSAARAQFAPLAAGAQTHQDLYAIINLMVGELRSSHLGASFHGSSSLQDGYTGLQFDALELQHGRLRITSILPDSPAALADDNAGMRVGEYVLAVDGLELKPGISFDMLLQRTIGRRVVLRVAPQADGENAREFAIRPIGASQYHYLCYRNWVYTNEAYVHRISGGRLGYVHIRTMSYEAYQLFLADLDAETHSKEGLVVDVRFNGGGHIATFILDVLMRRSILRSALRGQPFADAGHVFGNRVLDKPTVLVVNEGSGSNTEMLTEGYRRMGLGKVVGRPTAGAVIGMYQHPLLDGGILRLPRMKVATPEGEDLEGKGREVDLNVALPVGQSARGIDSQLDAAVQVLLDQIDERGGAATEGRPNG